MDCFQFSSFQFPVSSDFQCQTVGSLAWQLLHTLIPKNPNCGKFYFCSASWYKKRRTHWSHCRQYYLQASYFFRELDILPGSASPECLDWAHTDKNTLLKCCCLCWYFLPVLREDFNFINCPTARGFHYRSSLKCCPILHKPPTTNQHTHKLPYLVRFFLC